MPIAEPENPGLTPDRAVQTSGTGEFQSSNTTGTELGYVHSVTSPIQTQLNALSSSVSAVTSSVATAAADILAIIAERDYLELEDFGGGGGGVDNTAALNAAAAALSSAPVRKKIRLRAGATYRFNSKPSNFADGVIIDGPAPSSCVLERHYSEAGGDDVGFLTWSGASGNGGGLRNVQLLAASGTTGGTMIVFTTPSEAAGFVLLDHVIVTGIGTYKRPLLVDGSANTSGTQGYRDVHIRNCQFFAIPPETEACRFRNVQNLFVSGSWANGNVFVAGAGGALTAGSSFFCSIDMLIVGELNVSNSAYVTARGRVATLNFASTTNTCSFHGIVTTVDGITDAGVDNFISSLYATRPAVEADGRLTLTSATPILTADVSGATTVYYTPYRGNRIGLYDGTAWRNHVFAELSQATTDSTKSPAAVANNSNYDLFVWKDGSTLRCTRGPAWSSDTSRGTGAGTTELERVDGRLVNKIAITNGPAAQRGLYVGTVRSNGSAAIDMIFGGIASGGTAARLCVWNMYNRTPMVSAHIGDTTDSWAYATSTWRSANSSTGMRASFVIGEAAKVEADYHCYVDGVAGVNAGVVGVGLDVTNAFTGFPGNAQARIKAHGGFKKQVAAGFHFAQAVEFAVNSTSVTFQGDNATPTSVQNSLTVTLDG